MIAAISPRDNRHDGRAGGFTLLEVMIAIAVLATILAVLFSTYSAAVERAARARDLSQISHEARVLLQLMTNDLRTAYVRESTAQAQQVLTQTKVRPTSFLGEDHTTSDQAMDKLVFSTILPVQRPDIPDTEMCRVTYSLEPLEETPVHLGLFRRVNCSLDPEATDQDHLTLLTELATGLDFKYYDAQGNEYPDWTSEEPRAGKRLPARVKITLVLADQQGERHPFEMLTDFVLSS
jgi:type II secretion system protein J